jgi:hypothetical protein
VLKSLSMLSLRVSLFVGLIGQTVFALPSLYVPKAHLGAVISVYDFNGKLVRANVESELTIEALHWGKTPMGPVGTCLASFLGFETWKVTARSQDGKNVFASSPQFQSTEDLALTLFTAIHSLKAITLDGKSYILLALDFSVTRGSSEAEYLSTQKTDVVFLRDEIPVVATWIGDEGQFHVDEVRDLPSTSPREMSRWPSYLTQQIFPVKR